MQNSGKKLIDSNIVVHPDFFPESCGCMQNLLGDGVYCITFMIRLVKWYALAYWLKMGELEKLRFSNSLVLVAMDTF